MKPLTLELARPLVERLLSDLQARLGADLLAAALFGSVARGVGHKTSDIDLLIVHRGDARDALDRFVNMVLTLRRSAEYQALEAQGFLPEPAPIFLTPERLSEHPRVLLDLLDHGVVLYDPLRLLDEALARLRKETGGPRGKEDHARGWDLVLGFEARLETGRDLLSVKSAETPTMDALMWRRTGL